MKMTIEDARASVLQTAGLIAKRDVTEHMRVGSVLDSIRVQQLFVNLEDKHGLMSVVLDEGKLPINPTFNDVALLLAQEYNRGKL